MTAAQAQRIEEKVLASYPTVNKERFTKWLKELPELRRRKLMTASLVSSNSTEVATWYLELCLEVFVISNTGARG